MISETKLDETFPTVQFSCKASASLIGLITTEMVVVLFSVLERIPSQLTARRFRSDFEYFFFETNLRKTTWHLCYSCNPHKNYVLINIDFPRNEIDLHSSNCDNLLLLEEFNHRRFMSGIEWEPIKFILKGYWLNCKVNDFYLWYRPDNNMLDYDNCNKSGKRTAIYKYVDPLISFAKNHIHIARAQLIQIVIKLGTWFCLGNCD